MANAAFGAYWREVWVWGSRYSADTFIASPLREGVVRTANWLGFHAALAVGVVVALRDLHSLSVVAPFHCLGGDIVCGGVRGVAIFSSLLLSLVAGFYCLGRAGAYVAAAEMARPGFTCCPDSCCAVRARVCQSGAGRPSMAGPQVDAGQQEAAAIVRSVARPGRPAAGVGVPARCIRLFRSSGGDSVSGFATDNRGAGGQASYFVES